MTRFRNFEEYIEKVYRNTLIEEFKEFLVVDNNFEYDVLNTLYIDNIINNVRVIKIICTKSHFDYLEFMVFSHIEYETVCETNDLANYSNEGKIYGVKMGGTFAKGFKPLKDDVELFDNEEIETFQNNLVPIIKSHELDKYATKFLKVFYPEALKKPIKLDVTEILQAKGLKYYYAPLEKDVLGKIYFAEDDVYIYQKLSEDDAPLLTHIYPGTILIDYEKAKIRGQTSVNNTLIHEAVHWFFHRNYFELRQQLNNKNKYMVCYRSERRYFNKDINRMERQAKRITPRILIPKEPGEIKIKEIIEDTFSEGILKRWGLSLVLEQIVRRFAATFGVSLQTAKIRIKELGYTQFDGVCNYDDQGRRLVRFVVPPKLLLDNQSFIIEPKTFEKIVKENKIVKSAINLGELLYINQMIVANNPRYIKNGKLTNYALKHPDECALIFNAIQNDEPLENKRDEENYLTNAKKDTKSKVIVESSQLSKVLSLSKVNFNHFNRHKKDIPDDLAGTIKYHYKKCKENKVIFSILDLATEADISDSSLREYMKGKMPKDRIRVLKLGLAMELSTPYLLDMLNKYDDNKRNITIENIIFNTIIYCVGSKRTTLEEVYRQLCTTNQQGLLEMSEKWLKTHGIEN